jgi:hypothetical protein
MIPRTFPSTINTTTGRRQMVVSFITSISGLQRWKDYIPVKFVLDDTPTEASYNNDGYIAIDELSSTVGKQAWLDYIPVYLDNSATDAWEVDSNGFIQVGTSGFGGVPNSLFASGEQGAWYDPSDLNTLFQDQAGTTPVTAVEQPVSLMLDKSKGGVGTNGVRRYNLLSFTEQFNDAAWSKVNNGSISAINSTTAPDGTVTADTWLQPANATTSFIYQNNINVPANTSLICSFYIKKITGTWVRFFAGDSSTVGASNAFRSHFDLDNGTVGTSSASGTGTTINSAGCTITSANNGFWKIQIQGVLGNINSASFGIRVVTTDNTTTALQNGSVFLWGADLRLASDASATPTYQPITDQWYNTMAGNHAYTPSTATASRPVLSARVNLLEKTEQFDDAAVWATAGRLTVSANTTETTDPLGGNTAEKITETVDNGTHRVLNIFSTTLNTTFTFSCYAKKGTRQWMWLNLGSASTGGINENNTVQFFDLDNIILGQQITTQISGSLVVSVFVSASITDVNNGWRRLSITATTQNNPANLSVTIGLSTANGTISYAGTTSDYGYIWGADLRVANDGVGIPSYQRVDTSTSYDTAGFPLYLRADGTDDYMLTNSIDFTATDKMTVWAGVRKLSDAARAILCELSATGASNNGSFTIDAPGFTPATDKYVFSSKGTVDAFGVATNLSLTAPVSNVLTGIGDISADICQLRANGAQVINVLTDQGSGNYGNYPLYLFRRGGTTLPFNGRCYGMIVRGAQSSTAQIEATETYLNQKTKAF